MIQGSLFWGWVEVEEPPPAKDVITQATSAAFADEDARRGPHYSHYISKLEAIQLAAEAIARGQEHHDEVAHEFCDEEGLYNDARKEVLVRVFEEHCWLEPFFYGGPE